MSRVMRDGQTAAYRAVIMTTHEDGEERVSYAGPYATKGAATAAITRAKHRAEWYSRWGQESATGHVESSSITWTKVES